MTQSIQAPVVGDIPLQVVLMQMVTSNWVSQSVYAAAKLGIADLLKDGNKNYYELAEATKTHPRSLYRLLRALASVGVFAETETGYFTLTPLANYLRSDISESLRAMAIMNGEEQYHAWGNLLYSLQTGENTFKHLYGSELFDWFNQNPPQAKIFDDAMTSYSVVQNPGVVAGYDFSGIKTLVDVAGGHGKLLTDILKDNPRMQGILFDQESVIEGAKSFIAGSEVGDRCTLVSGDFFESVPSGGDAYILKMIIHDWSDELAIKILKNCRTVMPKDGKLLIVEQVVPPGNQASFSKFLDLHMLLMCEGGCERTEEEFQVLLEKAGFQMTRIVPLESVMSVVEAIPI
ncbi:methyltransferase [Calothrix sp. 336/3]|uniref:methyltransferase n=1 Tax=Calothrix sp. 336/3 TaxID=1337936 RepID=UPI0004E3A029|nr:methyltransferase [Calothrix sp. 336/3]AKG21840.1 methyltransferase [Calothrix sp. 336/3]